MAGPYDTSPLGTGQNWVTKRGGLPPFVRAVAHALIRQGKSESDAIRIAIGVMQRAIKSGKWASLNGHASAKTLGKSGASVAHWDAMKTASNLASEATVSIDLAGPKGYEHGWKFVGTGTSAGISHPGFVKAHAKAVQQATDSHEKYGTGTSLIREHARRAAVKASAAKAKGDQEGFMRHAGAAMGFESAADAIDRSTTTNLSGGTVPTIDLAGGSTVDKMLPDMASVKKAAAKLNKLPPGLRKSMAARLQARAKQLGGSVNLAVPTDLRAAARRKAKAKGATLQGTSSYPTQTEPLWHKAIKAVGRGGADHNRIRQYLLGRGKQEGWTDPATAGWNPDGSLKGTSK